MTRHDGVRQGDFYVVNVGGGNVYYGECACATFDHVEHRLTYMELEWDGWLACIHIPEGWHRIYGAGRTPACPDTYREVRERDDCPYVRWARGGDPPQDMYGEGGGDECPIGCDCVSDAREYEANLTSGEAHLTSGEVRVTSGEVRVTSETGASKGSKLARFDLIPQDALWELAEHYGKGAEKYDEVRARIDPASIHEYVRRCCTCGCEEE